MKQYCKQNHGKTNHGKNCVIASEMKFNKGFGLLLWSIAFLTSLFASLFIYCMIPDSPFENIFLLPLCYSLIIIPFFELYNYAKNSIVVLIVLLCEFVKNTVTPFIMSLGDYYSYFRLISTSDINCAIALMLWESFCIQLFFIWTIKNIHRRKPVSFLPRHKIKRKTYCCVLFAVFVGCVVLVFLEPSIQSSFLTIFDGDKLQSDTIGRNQYSVGSSSRILYTLFFTAFPILQALGSAYLIYRIKLLKGDCFFSVILSMFVIGFNCLFMSGSDGWIVILVSSLFYVTYRIFPRQKKAVGVIAIGVGLFLVGAIYASKINSYNFVIGRSTFEVLSYMLQGYFPGVSNVAGAYYACLPDTLQSLFYDIYYMIPFRNSIFGISGDYTSLLTFASQNAALSNILPFVSQSRYYLGSVLAPLPTIILLYFAYKQERTIRLNSNPLIMVSQSLIMFYCVVSPFLYNISIFGARFFMTLLPVYLISRFVEDGYNAFSAQEKVDE